MRFQQRRCTACDWPRSSGHISFGGRIHEPHCASCLSDWEKILRSLKGAAAFIGLSVFRDWQRERAQRMGVAA
jgi:hypothetical protein